MTNNYTPYETKERWHISKSVNPLTLGVFIFTLLSAAAGAYAYYNKDQQAQDTRIGAVEAGVIRLSGEVKHVREIQQVQVAQQNEMRSLMQDQMVRFESKLDNIENYLRDASK